MTPKHLRRGAWAAGLAVAYALSPSLRRRYRPASFAFDVGLQFTDPSLTAPLARELEDYSA